MKLRNHHRVNVWLHAVTAGGEACYGLLGQMRQTHAKWSAPYLAQKVKSSQVSLDARRRRKIITSNSVQPRVFFTRPRSKGLHGTEVKERWKQSVPKYISRNNFPFVCTCRTFPIECPKLFVGVHEKDILAAVSTQVLSSPSVWQANLQCRKQKSISESCTSIRASSWLSENRVVLLVNGFGMCKQFEVIDG